MKRTVIIVTILFSTNLPGFTQSNDDCAGAIHLEAGDQCAFATYSNEGATMEDPDSIAPDPSCGFYKGADVWFSVQMPSSGALRIETSNLAGATPHSIAIYSGTCGALIELLCIQLDKQKTILQPSLSGQTLYIRVYSYNGLPGSSFELCVYEPVIPANDHCEYAIDLTAGESCLAEKYTNAFATSQPITTAPNPSCGAYRGGDVWFKTIVPASGNIRIETKNLSSATSKSVAVYTGDCGDFTQVFCNQLDDGETFYDPNWAGKTVYIRIFSYDSEEGGDFEICISNPSEPINDDCSQAMELLAEENCNPQFFTNALATAEQLTVAPDPSCGAYRGGDVWFRTEMPASGNLKIETNNFSSATPKSMVFYTGSCGAFTEIYCSQNDGKITINDQALAGKTLYVRIFSYDNEEGGLFDLCFYKSSCQDVVIEAGTYSICQDESLTFGSQILTESGSYTELFETVEGCDSLVNLTINVDPAYNESETVYLCMGERFVFPDGAIVDDITTQINHTSTLQTIHQCDSIIETTVDIHQVDNSVIQSGLTLTANSDALTYQWIDCANGNIPVEGETGKTFTAKIMGEYAVLITDGFCTSISDCFNINVLGLHSEKNAEPKLYPNPIKESFKIDFGNSNDRVQVIIYNLNGKIVYIKNFIAQSKAGIDASLLGPGIYLLKTISEEGTYSFKLIKE